MVSDEDEDSGAQRRVVRSGTEVGGGDRTGPPERRADVLGDLIYLRKGRGATLDRLAQADAAVEACGGREQPLETVAERLRAALRPLRSIPGGAALWAAYGFDPPYDAMPTLRERRAHFAESVGKAPYTVREWEDAALAELTLRLLAHFYAGAPLPHELPIPHGGFLLREVRLKTLIRDGRFVESRQWRDLISLVDGARGFVYGTYTPTVLDNFEGCRLGESKQAASGGVLHTLLFPRPLRRGQVHRFAFREQVPAHAPPKAVPKEDFAGQTFESPTLRFHVEVAFQGRRPTQVWSYDKLSRIERPGSPNDRNIIRRKDRALAEFFDLYGGLCAGVGWTIS